PCELPRSCPTANCSNPSTRRPRRASAPAAAAPMPPTPTTITSYVPSLIAGAPECPRTSPAGRVHPVNAFRSEFRWLPGPPAGRVTSSAPFGRVGPAARSLSMGSKAGIWRRKGRKGWYAQTNGKTTRLGDERPEALRRFHGRKAGGTPPDKGEDTPVRDVFDLYLARIKAEYPDSCKRCRHWLESFLPAHPRQLHGRSLLAEQQVHHPTPPDVLGPLSAVGQDVRVRAAGAFEGVGQHRHPAEGPPVVDGRGETGDGAPVPGQPGGGDGRDGAERVAEEVAEEGDLFRLLGTERGCPSGCALGTSAGSGTAGPVGGIGYGDVPIVRTRDPASHLAGIPREGVGLVDGGGEGGGRLQLFVAGRPI